MRRSTPLLALVVIQVSAQLAVAQRLPYVASAEVPQYPAVALAAGLTATVRLEVTIRNSRVARAEPLAVGSISQGFVQAALANVRTWRFVEAHDTTIVATFAYTMSDAAPTDYPTNPRVELDLPTHVTLVGRKAKPATLHGR